MVFVFFSMTFLSMMHSKSIHVVTDGKISFFFKIALAIWDLLLSHMGSSDGSAGKESAYNARDTGVPYKF